MYTCRFKGRSVFDSARLAVQGLHLVTRFWMSDLRTFGLSPQAGKLSPQAGKCPLISLLNIDKRTHIYLSIIPLISIHLVSSDGTRPFRSLTDKSHFPESSIDN